MRKILLITFLLSAILLFCRPPAADAEKTDRIVAIVNGDIITADELDLFVKMSAMDEQGGTKSVDPKELRKQLLDRMIEDRLILQEAKRTQLKIDEGILEERIQGIKEKAGSELAFEQALKSQGVTLTELRQKLKNQLMIYSLIQKEVRSKVHISPKELTDYYEQNQDRFVVPETAVVDSIFVKDKEALKEVQAELDRGKDFSEVSGAFSQKSNLGSVARGQLKKDLEDVIFSLDIGKRSEPIPVEDGYYIFFLKEKHLASRSSIDEVKDKINRELEDVKMEKLLKEWLEELKDKAYISIREP
jgi:parvulin-like peptidyl-prolyl isomerase